MVGVEVVVGVGVVVVVVVVVEVGVVVEVVVEVEVGVVVGITNLKGDNKMVKTLEISDERMIQSRNENM